MDKHFIQWISRNFESKQSTKVVGMEYIMNQHFRGRVMWIERELVNRVAPSERWFGLEAAGLTKRRSGLEQICPRTPFLTIVTRCLAHDTLVQITSKEKQNRGRGREGGRTSCFWTQSMTLITFEEKRLIRKDKSERGFIQVNLRPKKKNKRKQPAESIEYHFPKSKTRDLTEGHAVDSGR